jgi:hypothetical protein
MYSCIIHAIILARWEFTTTANTPRESTKEKIKNGFWFSLDRVIYLQACLLIFDAIFCVSSNYSTRVKPNLSPVIINKVSWKQLHSFTSMVLEVFELQGQSWVVETETIWPLKIKIFNIWPVRMRLEALEKRFLIPALEQCQGQLQWVLWGSDPCLALLWMCSHHFNCHECHL